MCEFFSCVSDGKGNIHYFDWEIRKKILSGDLKDYEHDSHSWICKHFKLNCDKVNKYEYNPLSKKFTIDQINNVKDDSKSIEKVCKKLDFSKIVPPLILKEIVHPFELKKTKPNKHDIKQLKKWDSVRDSVGDSVRDSVRGSVGYPGRDSVGDSVRGSVGNSIWDSVGGSVRNSIWGSVGASVGNSIWDSVGGSVWDSVGNSVRNSIWYSVRASVWDSIGAYTSSFTDLKRNQWQYTENIKTTDKNPFNPCIKLWEKGLVPSFDGKIWRLHSGKNADIVFEITKKELEKIT